MGGGRDAVTGWGRHCGLFGGGVLLTGCTAPAACRDVLCTDKTGTLTEDRVTLLQHLDSAGNPCSEVLGLAYANSHFQVRCWASRV